MKVIVISSPLPVHKESKMINQLFDNGLHTFHLRKSSYTRAHYKQLITEIDEAYHNRIALHQYHELTTDFAIKRLHYTEEFRKQALESKTIPQTDNMILSTSIHHLQDFNDLKGFDYTFFGPVFNSLSKPGYTGVLTEDFKLPEYRKNVELIALGGINAEKAHQVNAMGFDGLAVLGAIWNNPSKALHNFKSIQEKC